MPHHQHLPVEDNLGDQLTDSSNSCPSPVPVGTINITFIVQRSKPHVSQRSLQIEEQDLIILWPDDILTVDCWSVYSSSSVTGKLASCYRSVSFTVSLFAYLSMLYDFSLLTNLSSRPISFYCSIHQQKRHFDFRQIHEQMCFN